MKRRLSAIACLTLVVALGGGQLAPLEATFTMRPGVPHVGDLVRFEDTSSGAPVEWLWDFGDGGVSELQNPTHVFNEEGPVEISLTVTDALGQSATTRRED